jgi:hypothetical protein
MAENQTAEKVFLSLKHKKGRSTTNPKNYVNKYDQANINA